jgi:hypothetical protein
VRWAAIAIGAAGVCVVLLVGGWIAGEMHYRNCLQANEFKFPVAFVQGSEGGGGSFGVEAVAPHWNFYEEANRLDALSGCSRWP